MPADFIHSDIGLVSPLRESWWSFDHIWTHPHWTEVSDKIGFCEWHTHNLHVGLRTYVFQDRQVVSFLFRVRKHPGSFNLCKPLASLAIENFRGCLLWPSFCASKLIVRRAAQTVWVAVGLVGEIDWAPLICLIPRTVDIGLFEVAWVAEIAHVWDQFFTHEVHLFLILLKSKDYPIALEGRAGILGHYLFPLWRLLLDLLEGFDWLNLHLLLRESPIYGGLLLLSELGLFNSQPVHCVPNNCKQKTYPDYQSHRYLEVLLEERCVYPVAHHYC